MTLRHQAPRGTRDLLPEDLERWQWVEDRARAVLARYGYREIRTPIFEDYELFARTSGESSDVVQKEMYRFRDQGERDLALRPEGTAGVCRAFLEHGLAAKGRIHRLWYMGPMFRYGRPQKGRFRQFWQIGAEIVGTAAPGADVEMIALFVDLFEAWGFRDLVVVVNSVGTPETRRAYGEALRRWLAPVRARLGAESQQRLDVNPLRVLDSKDEGDLALLRGEWPAGSPAPPMPHMLDSLDAESRAHWEAVLAGLTATGIAYEIDHGLVRGLDYYTRTAFEFTHGALGAQNAILGGGRYDGLSDALGGPAAPGIGFAIGEDRLVMSLQEKTPAESVLRKPDVYVAPMAGMNGDAARLARELRRHELVVELGDDAFRLKKSFEAATKVGAKYILIVGENEVKADAFALKNLATGEQVSIVRANLAAWLRSNRG